MIIVDNEIYKRVMQMENGDWREVHLYYQLNKLKNTKDELEEMGQHPSTRKVQDQAQA